MGDNDMYERLMHKYGPVLTADEAANVLKHKSGKSLVHACATGKCHLKVVKERNRWLVKADDLANYIEGLGV